MISNLYNLNFNLTTNKFQEIFNIKDIQQWVRLFYHKEQEVNWTKIPKCKHTNNNGIYLLLQFNNFKEIVLEMNFNKNLIFLLFTKNFSKLKFIIVYFYFYFNNQQIIYLQLSKEYKVIKIVILFSLIFFKS